jgi:hypothetical protein
VPATVRHWLREHGLRTARSLTRPNDPGVAARECARHGTTDFVRRGDDKGWRCLRCRSDAEALGDEVLAQLPLDPTPRRVTLGVR